MKNDLKYVKYLILLILPLLISSARSFPVPVPNNDASHDEKTYPNGTVVGKYAYVDSEGNPIQVKYYADDHSYGVELSSVKILKGEKATLPSSSPPNSEHFRVEQPSDIFKYPKFAKKSISRDYENKEKKSRFKNKDSDYDVYLQSDLPPSHCGGGAKRVKIYNLEKNGRKIRSILNNIVREEEDDDLDVQKICERY